jgi:HlyD family secretion protein
MRKFLLIIVVVVIIVAGYFFFFRNGNNAENTPSFIEITAERGSISKTVAASGSVTSNLDVEIKCKASGEIITLPYDISDMVHEGDLLMELDPEDEERSVDLAEVSLSVSQARLNRTQENLNLASLDLETAYERAEIDLEIIEARAEDSQASADRIEEASETDLDAGNLRFDELEAQDAALGLLRLDVTLARADVQSSRINLDNAHNRLDDTRVYAPMDGIVTARYVQIGQIISSGINSTSGGTPVLMVSDHSRLFILARVDESNIGQVETGQKVNISADAYLDEVFEGDVTRIAPTGVNMQNVVTFEVRIELTSENKSLLKPEMTADVEIIVAEKPDAILIPSNAVMSMHGSSMVMVPGVNGEPEHVQVVTGLDNGEFTEIISGLSEGDTVLINESSEASMWRTGDGQRRGPPPGMMMGRPH